MMLISSKGRYALRVMVDLGSHGDTLVPLKDIAVRQEVSLKYLESIAALLSRGGLIEGFHGKGGGYRLTRPLKDYNALEILLLTENTLAATECMSGTHSGCHRADFCPTMPVWANLDKLIRDYFAGISLQDLVLPGRDEACEK